MAKIIVTVTVFLFILALVQARTPLDLPENEVTTQDFQINEQAKNYESEKTESETNDFVPLTVINFQTINRQFPRQPSLTLRHRRPCRHHRLGTPARSHHGEVSYGNDMLISSGDNKVKVVRQIPVRHVTFHHGDTNGPGFPYWRDDDLAKGEGFKSPRYHHRHVDE